jgi:hypothetical protein
MASSEVHWANVEGLMEAAIRIEAQAGRFDRIIGNLYSQVNNSILNPDVFDPRTFAKWEGDVRDWDEGVRGVSRSIRATAGGVHNMARAFRVANEDTSNMADDLYRFINGGPASGSSGSGGLNNPHIPPLTPPTTSGGGGGGGGNPGGSNGRH